MNWKENREYVRILLDEMNGSELYSDYLSSEANGFEEDKNFIIELFKNIIAPNEKLFDYYESLNLSWVDDYPLVNTNVIRGLKRMSSFTLKKNLTAKLNHS